MWRISAQISGDAGVLVLLAGFYHSKVVCSSGLLLVKTETLEDELEVAKAPGHWNKFKKQIHARIPKPGRTPSVTPEWLIYKMGTDKVAAQAAKSWMGAITASVMWDPKSTIFPQEAAELR